MRASISGVNFGRRIARGAAAGLLLIAALFAAYLWIALHWAYSTGDRAGYLQKVSHKGWICKTWEGELSMVSIPGSAPEKFYFTVRDESVITAMEKLMGARVTLSYEQHKGLPTSCFGETEYFVTGVRAESQ